MNIQIKKQKIKIDNFTFYSKLLSEEYKHLLHNEKIFYSLLLSLHERTPISEDGIRYIDFTLDDMQDIFFTGRSNCYKIKQNLINAGLIGEVKQFYNKDKLNTRKKIVAFYIKKKLD